MLHVALTSLLLTIPANAPVAATQTAVEIAPAKGVPDAPPPVDLESDSPPPSTWDKQQRGEQEGPHPVSEPQERTLVDQIGRSLLGLALVVLLVYVLGKIAMKKLGAVGMAPAQGKRIQVRERVSLGPKHFLFVVDIDEGPTLLLGGSDMGMQVLRELTTQPPEETRSFKNLMKPLASKVPNAKEDHGD